ncbi:hypothetical protein GGF31_004084 [Allomyces arbusculus]|nr:hypothetical protein GGF31_004084 [Allomyces arbusculus]
MTDVEQQQKHDGAENDKPTLSDGATPLRTSWARRLVPTNRYARYLCFGMIFAVVVFVVVFLALWFTTEPIAIALTLTRPEAYQVDAVPVQWMLKGDTEIMPGQGPWGIKVWTRNDNVFDVTFEGVDMTAMLYDNDGRNVVLGKTMSPQPEVWAPAKRKLEVQAMSSLPLVWDLSIAKQAQSLAWLLVLCGVNATSLPAPLTSRWDLPDPRYNAPAMVKWQVRARRVRGLMGLPMPSTVDAPQGLSVNSPQSLNWVFCDMNRGKVAEHIQQLVNLTVRVCESGMCEY